MGKCPGSPTCKVGGDRGVQAIALRGRSHAQRLQRCRALWAQPSNACTRTHHLLASGLTALY